MQIFITRIKTSNILLSIRGFIMFEKKTPRISENKIYLIMKVYNEFFQWDSNFDRLKSDFLPEKVVFSSYWIKSDKSNESCYWKLIKYW